MKPLDFSKHTQLMRGPDDSIEDLPILVVHYEGGGRAMISCWQLSWIDLLRVLFTRRIFAAIWGGQHPPILLSTDAKDIGVVETLRYLEERA